MKRLFGLFKNRWVTSILGLLAICILIWFVGPLIAVVGIIPLKSAIWRLVAILAVVCIWGLNNLRMQVRVSKANSDMATDMVDAEPTSDPASSQSEEEVRVLRDRFDQALSRLKKTARGKGAAGIYDLPWYVIIGPPGSGKTTALVNSGLRFPLEDTHGKQSLTGVGGTRNCDWWFTDEAVLLDTAGRYTTQDSHAEADSAAWKGFLGLLKKHRRRRPINGAIVAVSLSDLMTQSAVEKQQQISAIRKRLQELEKELGLQFPVYVMLTKCDLVSGFTEFFDHLGREERTQVWGMTFPVGINTEPQTATDFLSQFNALVDRVNKQLVWRLQQETDPQRRAHIFSFPQQLASLSGSIDDFLSEVFSNTRYDSAPLFRGVYLTSGTQEGAPIDRVKNSLVRNFGIAPQMIRPHVGEGRSYFVTRLFREVIFSESDLAGANRKFEVQRRWLQRSAYAGALALAAAAILGWTTSFTRNEVHTYRYKSALEDFQEIKAMQGAAPNSLDQLLERLNGIKNVTEVYKSFEDEVPFLMGLGLYQGDKLTIDAKTLYREELNELLLPTLKYRFEQYLTSEHDSTDLQYEALKAYLMLADEEHRDDELLALWAALDWQTLYPDQPEIQSQYRQHMDSMMALGFSPASLDEDIVARTRQRLTSVPISELLYGRLKRDYDATDTRPFRLIDATGPSGDQVFTRKSGLSLNEGMSSLFTYDGYHDHFKESIQELTRISSEERWILDSEEHELTESELADVREQITDQYFEDYIRSWDNLLADIEISGFSSVRKAADTLELMSGSNSPIRNLLRAVGRHTALAQSGQLEELANQALSQGSGSRLARLFQAAPTDAIVSEIVDPAQIVNEHFADFNRLMGDSAGGADPVEKIVELFSSQFAMFDSMAMGVGANPIAAAQGVGSGDIVVRMQEQASAQPEPMRAWLLQVVQNSRQVTLNTANFQINEKWKSEILPLCQRAVDGRYPFFEGSSKEIALMDFGRLFGPGGLFENFFDENIKPFVQVSAGGWSWKRIGSSSIGMSTNTLRQFERAAKIRELYFQSGGQTPSVSFGLKPVYLDANVRSFDLEIDGQSFRYRHGPTRITQAVWPGPNISGQVRIEFEDDSGARLADTIQGSWAWFRLLDRAELEVQSNDLVLASFEDRGRRTTWEVRASTVINPFFGDQIDQFRCPSSL